MNEVDRGPEIDTVSVSGSHRPYKPHMAGNN